MDNIVCRKENVNTESETRNLFFLLNKKPCPLKHNSLKVYSYLVYRLGQSKGDEKNASVTIRQIENGTGLDERSINTAIDELIGHNLAHYTKHKKSSVTRTSKSFERTNGKLCALQGDSASWFSMRKNAIYKKWYDQFAYFPITVPKNSPLTSRQNCLLGLIKRKPQQKLSWYALKVGVGRNTIPRAIEELRKYKLVSENSLSVIEGALPAPKPKVVKTAPKTNNWLLYDFFLKEEIIPAGTEFTWYDYNETHFQDTVNKIGDKMTENQYSTVEIEKYWRNTTTLLLNTFGPRLSYLEHFVRTFPNLFSTVQKVTAINRGAGTFQGANALGLLEKETARHIKVIKDSVDSGGNIARLEYFPIE